MKESEILTFKEPEWNRSQILRFAGAGETDSISPLLEECIKEIRDQLHYRVCYKILPFQKKEAACDFDAFQVDSKALSEHLKASEKVVVFAATVGMACDRMCAKYSSLSPAKALMFQAIGAHRVEALCDAFCEKMSEEFKLTPRFSPGYRDLSLSVQRDIFKVLDASKWLGITLNSSLLISPAKSVTAFMGIEANSTD